MNEKVFLALRNIYEHDEVSNSSIINELINEDYISSDGTSLTQKGINAISPYKVNNAIIMAAGYSARCMPLSNVIPKGLFRIKGDILIEREIEQLIASGITNIIVVIGYLADKFEYLKDKYSNINISLVYNKDYNKYNNIASLFCVKELIGNSYILCSDNYFSENIFHSYVYHSYYSCVYTVEYADEYCVTSVDRENNINGIKRGGSNCWYTIGDAYFDNDFSNIFVNYLEEEWSDYSIRNMLMDDFHIRHIDYLKLRKVERPRDLVYEFDTIQEIKGFDKDFNKFENENLSVNNVNKVFSKYETVKSYHSVPTEQLSGRLHLNENLFKPSPRCLDVLKKITLEDIYLYDLSYKDELVEAISDNTGISTNNIFIHNGSSEVIKSIFSIILSEGDVILVPSPGWSYYKSVADSIFAKSIYYNVCEGEDSYYYDVDDLLQKAMEYSPKIIVITSPQMPTGCEIPHDEISKVIELNQNSIIMLDEAYWGYEDYSNSFEKEIITKYSNIVISRTFSKFYGLANIRIGYGLCSYPLRRTIGLDLPLFRVSGISRKIAKEAILDTDYYSSMRKETKLAREWFINELNKISDVKAFQSGSNFVFIKLKNGDPDKVKAYMEENNILIREFMDNDALRLRITIAPIDILKRVIIQLKKALE